MADSITVVESPARLPPRPEDGHKGLFGRVLIVGGNDEMLGAPVFAGMAALRMGAGLVQVALPKSVLPAALSVTPELIGLIRGTGAASIKRLLAAAESADALVIGPGLGIGRDAAAQLDQLIRLNMPMVLDADALNLLALRRRWPKDFRAKAVLTPHPGEMSRLAKLIGWDATPRDDAGRLKIAADAARSFGQVVLLKGHRTIITDGQRAYVNLTGDSTLAKAGSGDVLSGIIGCLLAQNLGPFDAATAGAWLHGRAGELAGQRLGKRSALARDVIDSLGIAIAAM